jgi:hypothetical protein
MEMYKRHSFRESGKTAVLRTDCYTFSNGHGSGVTRYHSMMMSGGCCTYGPISVEYGLWTSAGLMYNLLKMMVIADSAGDVS